MSCDWEESEILILGGSLAGMACAIELKRLGYQPLVLEKSVFPRPKLCGEFLGPDALAALEDLGLLALIQRHAFGPVEQTLFYNRTGQSIKIQHRWMGGRFPYGLALPREVLDTLLLNEARRLGVEVLEGHRVLSPVERILSGPDTHSMFRVTAQSSDQLQAMRCIDAAILVDATGRSGKLRSQVALSNSRNENSPKKSKKRIGIQCHVRLAKQWDNRDLHMFLFPGGYGGLQPIGENLANVCMLVDTRLAKAMHLDFSQFVSATIGQNPAALGSLQDAKLEGAFNTTADVNLSGEDHGEDRSNGCASWLRIGDASVTVDPFTGSGMAHALETGRLAANSIGWALRNGWDYTQMLRRYQDDYNGRYKKRLQWMSYMRPVLEKRLLQDWLWPFVPPILPLLAKMLR